MAHAMRARNRCQFGGVADYVRQRVLGWEIRFVARPIV